MSPTEMSSGMSSPRGLGATAGADGQDFALLGLLFGGVGDDQAGSGGLLGFAGADDDTVVKGMQTHGSGLLWHALAVEG